MLLIIIDSLHSNSVEHGILLTELGTKSLTKIQKTLYTSYNCVVQLVVVFQTRQRLVVTALSVCHGLY